MQSPNLINIYQYIVPKANLTRLTCLYYMAFTFKSLRTQGRRVHFPSQRGIKKPHVGARTKSQNGRVVTRDLQAKTAEVNFSCTLISGRTKGAS